MIQAIPGIHHVTAISGSARENLDFHVRILGLRLVKKTVNFDDPGTYHLYYGDDSGGPGTIMTYFPFAGAARGRSGAGMAVETAYGVRPGSVAFWIGRFSDLGLDFDLPADRFGNKVVTFTDPHGLELALAEDPSIAEPAASGNAGPVPFTSSGNASQSLPASPGIANQVSSASPHNASQVPASSRAATSQTPPIAPEHSIRRFHSVTLASIRPAETERLLTDVFGYEKTGEDAGRSRFESPSQEPGRVIDLVPSSERGRPGTGTIHHIAFRAESEASQLEWKSRLEDAGMQVTPVQDRQYFKSIYFREPGGVLFEIATDGPGFMCDESMEELGSGLKLPPWLETRRTAIEARLEEL